MEILAEAVRFFAGGRQILQGIDLELRPKEFLGIIGLVSYTHRTLPMIY